MTNYIFLIPLLPLIAFAVNIFFGGRLKEKSALVSIFTSVASCIISCAVIWNTQATHAWPVNINFDWISFGGRFLEFGFLVDPLSAVMLFVVTFIGSLIIIYSTGYMHGDPRYSRFFAYLSLFLFSMLGLVLSTNLIQMYVFWELVGVCSYFLIGFWFEKDSASNASKKAFITNRIGDVGFFIGIALLFYSAGTVSFSDLNHDFFHHHHDKILGVAALFLFCGAIGKSAQFPLHVWLPDAMEGPTPVSALIHAATMVAAGVYMVARLSPLLDMFPVSAEVVAITGTTTACLGAFIAITATDIKKVLAYSTISQLGYMIASIGMGGMSAGMFHLMTHAFFKALLFLGAGSVIHGTGTQDIREMGGLFKHMPKTAWTFLIATIAIAGVPPFAGFWSKDEILTHAFLSGHKILFMLLMVTAFFTAFYMFRLTFLTFFGKTRGHFHAHESPATMTVPLMILAFFAVIAGFPGSPFMHHWFQEFIHPGHPAQVNQGLMILSAAVSLAAITLAYVFYLVKTDLPAKMAAALKPLYIASSNKLWFDEIYTATFVSGFRWLSASLFKFDQNVIDGGVNGSAALGIWISKIKNWIDIYIVDGTVNFVGFFTRVTSSLLRLFQTGFIHNYLFFLMIGLLLMLYGFVK